MHSGIEFKFDLPNLLFFAFENDSNFSIRASESSFDDF